MAELLHGARELALAKVARLYLSGRMTLPLVVLLPLVASILLLLLGRRRRLRRLNLDAARLTPPDGGRSQ
jgi:hypothetical protein